MKLQLLLFFAIATPFVLFFSSVIYGGISPANVKNAVAKSGAYTQISAHFTKPEAIPVAQFIDFPIFVSKRLTPAYFQTKIESAIDDSANWITGKTQTPPAISFKELKEELQADHPEIMQELQYTPTSAALQKSHLSSQDQARYLEQTKDLKAFTDANFTFSFGDKLDGIKVAYIFLQIALPLLIVLLMFCIFLLAKQAISPPLKFKWVGAAFLTSSIVGFGCILLLPYITPAILGTHILQESEALSLFTPIFAAIINFYLENYVGPQEIVSTMLFIVAAACFLGAFLTRKQALPSIKPVYNVRSFWETPLKKEKHAPQIIEPIEQKGTEEVVS